AAGNINKALFAPMRYAVFDLVDSEYIALAHKIGTHAVPVGTELFEYGIDWNAAPFVKSIAPLVVCPHHCMRERPDRWNDMLDQASEFLNVFLAVIYIRLDLFGAERWTL